MFSIVSLFAQVNGACDSGWVENGYKCYQWLSPRSFTSCQSSCTALRSEASLLCVENAAQNLFIQQHNPGETLLGYNDLVTEGSFQWPPGCTSSYTNWAGGNPDNNSAGGPGGEDYVTIQPGGEWNDFGGRNVYCACEYTAGPTPSPTMPPTVTSTSPPSAKPTFTVTAVPTYTVTPAPTASPSSFCAAGWVEYSYKCYKFATRMSFKSCRSLCPTLRPDASMLCVENAGQDAFITSQVTQVTFIAYTDEVTEGTFVWQPGCTSSYTNWFGVNPDNHPIGGATGEDYATIVQGGGWNDSGDNFDYFCACEYTGGPTPSPTPAPSAPPSYPPSFKPSAAPSTATPSTAKPSVVPSPQPSSRPSSVPSPVPTPLPTASPTYTCLQWTLGLEGETCAATCAAASPARECKAHYFKDVLTTEAFYEMVASTTHGRTGEPVGSGETFCSGGVNVLPAQGAPLAHTSVYHLDTGDVIKHFCSYPMSASELVLGCDEVAPGFPSRRFCPCVHEDCDTVPWYLGYSGESCGSTCAREGRVCDAARADTVTDSETFAEVVNGASYLESGGAVGTVESFCTSVNVPQFAPLYPAVVTMRGATDNQTFCSHPDAAISTSDQVAFCDAVPSVPSVQRFCPCIPGRRLEDVEATAPIQTGQSVVAKTAAMLSFLRGAVV